MVDIMKTKLYLFRISIALLTFVLGIVTYLEFQFVRSYFGSRETEPTSVAQIEIREAIPQPEQEPVSYSVPPNSNEQEPAPDFDGTGSYYSAHRDLPKGFKKFDSLEIEMRDYSRISETSNYEGEAIPPKGSIRFRKTYRFVRVAIGGKEIGFETESIAGISYRFTGRFVAEENIDIEGVAIDLRGRLIKLKNGKKADSTDIELYVGGC